MFLVLACGGRNYEDRARIKHVLDDLNRRNRFTHLLHGAATGADSLAGEWAFANKIAVLSCPANWRAFRNSAGFIRNRAMADLCPDLVVAFPGGPGTRNMVVLARQRNLKIEVIDGQTTPGVDGGP